MKNLRLKPVVPCLATVLCLTAVACGKKGMSDADGTQVKSGMYVSFLTNSGEAESLGSPAAFAERSTLVATRQSNGLIERARSSVGDSYSVELTHGDQANPEYPQSIRFAYGKRFSQKTQFPAASTHLDLTLHFSKDAPYDFNSLQPVRCVNVGFSLPQAAQAPCSFTSSMILERREYDAVGGFRTLGAVDEASLASCELTRNAWSSDQLAFSERKSAVHLADGKLGEWKTSQVAILPTLNFSSDGNPKAVLAYSLTCKDTSGKRVANVQFWQNSDEPTIGSER